jgi:large subunit ribosomal protein L9
MDVILLKPVDNLGEQGDVVKVANGHARNMLFPRNLAKAVTPGVLKHEAARKESLKLQAKKRISEDKEIAAKIEAVSPVVIKATVGEEGKLFGTITPKELGRILSEKTGLELDRRSLTVENALNRVGEYNVTYKLSAYVEAALVIDIQAADA